MEPRGREPRRWQAERPNERERMNQCFPSSFNEGGTLNDQPSTLTSILSSPIMSPDPVAAYTSRGHRPAYAAILLAVGPNTIPRHYHPDHADRVLHSRHDPKLLQVGCLPSASAALRHAVLPASGKEWPGDKAPSFRWPEGDRRHSPKCSIRCDDDTRRPREMPLTIRNAGSARTQAHRDKIQGHAPSSPLSNARDPSGRRDELLSRARRNVAL
jgi:hypothetical protein